MKTSTPIRVAAVAFGACFALNSTHAEVFVDIGINASRVEADIADQPDTTTSNSSGVHAGVGIRRALSGRGDIGARLEIDDVDSDLLFAVRALDYRFHPSERLAVGAFFGAARLDLATPAYGYYLGGGVHFKELLKSWDLGLELRFGDKIARDNVLPSDPQGEGGRDDNFYDLSGVSLYLSRRF
jgi:hypothetical protein